MFCADKMLCKMIYFKFMLAKWFFEIPQGRGSKGLISGDPDTHPFPLFRHKVHKVRVSDRNM